MSTHFMMKKGSSVCPSPLVNQSTTPPPPLFQTNQLYLIPLLAAISKPVLCHPIFQLDQCPTYFWVNATPPPFIMIRFVYHRGCISTIYLEEVPPPTHTHGRAVARILRRGRRMWHKKVPSAPTARGVWGHAPPGHFWYFLAKWCILVLIYHWNI